MDGDDLKRRKYMDFRATCDKAQQGQAENQYQAHQLEKGV